MGIQINGNTNNINAGIGSLSIEDIRELDIIGVATASNFKTGISNLHSVGLTLSGGQIDVGSNIKIGTAGVVTATSFVGSGANLTGITVPGGATNLDLLDSSGTGNGRIRLGASQDLQIYHDGSHSWFKNTEGRLILQTDGDQIQLRGNSIVAFNGAASTEYLRISSNGNISINNSSGLSSTYSSFKHFSINNNLILNAQDSAGGFAGMQNNAYLNSSGNWVRVNNDHATSIGTDDGVFSFRNVGAGTGNISWNSVLSIDATGRMTQNGTTSADTASALTLKNGAAANEHTILELISDPNQYSMIYMGASDDRYRGQIRYKDNDHFMSFHTSNYERFRINSNGMFTALGAGPTSYVGSNAQENYHQIINSQAYAYTMKMRNYTWGYGLQIQTDDNTTREGLSIYTTKSGAAQTQAMILMNGTYYSRNNTYTSFSDIKLKENIVDANSQWDDIKNLKIRNFNFKTDDASQKMIGVIAQEVETISAGLVDDIPDKTENEDGTYTETGTHTKLVKYSILYMKAIKALQEAMTRIETLEAKVAALEGS